MSFPKQYGDTEGPLGFPQTDRQAKALEQVLAKLPKEAAFQYRKAALFKAPTELLQGERAEVSWISTEDPDRDHEVVIARGMDDAHFQLNPIVTLNHCYTAPPVGRSLWRRRVKDGARLGIKAKTHYPQRPASWTQPDWQPDEAFALIQADLLRGKSIGFLPLEVHPPTEADVRQYPDWKNVRLVIDRWLLLEYACVFLPAQQHAVVERVSKQAAHGLAGGFTPWSEIEAQIARHVASLDLPGFLEKVFQDTLTRHSGKV